MKLNNKKGFTIVELVIVIAVIAILAAVLIPNISNLVKKANASADESLVRNLNTALAMDTEKHATMTDALKAAKENGGYDVATIVTKNKDNKILWDSKNDCFVYLSNGSIKYLPNTKTGTAADVDLFEILDTMPTDMSKQKYSIYLAGSGKTVTAEIAVGFDAGANTVASLTYKNSGDAKSVIINTNGGTLTVEAAQDTVKHYGNSLSVEIKAVKGESYHEYGKVGFISVTSGRLVVESSAKVVTVYASAATATIDNNSGTIENSYVASGVSAKGNVQLDAIPDGKTIETIKQESETKSVAVAKVNDNYYSALDSAFIAALNLQNATIELISNVDLKGQTWKPIVIEAGKSLTIEGNGFAINNLTVTDFIRASDGSMIFDSGKAATYGCGLIGANGGNLTINNLTFDNAVSDMDLSGDTEKTGGSSQVAVVVAQNSGTCVFSNVIVKNSVAKGYTKVGILVGQAAKGTIDIDHCILENNSVVLEADGKDPDAACSGVIIGYVDPKKKGEGTDCQVVVNGIKLLDNKNEIDPSVQWTNTERKTEKGTIYVNDRYYLSSPTFVRGNRAANTVQFEKENDGFLYESK